MARAILIPVEGEPTVIDIDLKDSHSVMKHLDGGWIENVNVNYDAATGMDVGQRDVAMLVDEEGLVKGLPINKTATPFYCPNPRDGIICGPAILVGQYEDAEEGWDWTGLPESITPETVLKAGAFAMRMNGVAWA